MNSWLKRKISSWLGLESHQKLLRAHQELLRAHNESIERLANSFQFLLELNPIDRIEALETKVAALGVKKAAKTK